MPSENKQKLGVPSTVDTKPPEVVVGKTKLTPTLVSKVKRSVRGKKYSELTKEEFDILFDDYSNVSTVCGHNGIVDDSPDIDPKLGPKVGCKCPPKSAK